MVFYNSLTLYGAILGAAFLGKPLGMIHYFFGRLIIAGGLWGTLARRTSAAKKGRDRFSLVCKSVSMILRVK
jgi:hypothetical protein